MPLLIDLKPGEKVIINGAVIENAGTNTKLRVHNECNILRQKEILTGEEAVTPASRVYFCLQNAYIFPEKRDYYLELFAGFLNDYLTACPSAVSIVDELHQEVLQSQFYRALKTARRLLAHETQVLDHLQKNSEQITKALEEKEQHDAADKAKDGE